MYETLAELAKSIYNNMILNGSWNAINPKDAQIMALTTKVNELSTMTKKTNENSSKYGLIADWWKKKGNPVIEKESLSWYLYLNHNRKDCNRLYIRHKLEDCRMKHKTGKQEKFKTPK